jgi:hypothetical protein
MPGHAFVSFVDRSEDEAMTASARRWRLSILSTLLYTLAFNLTFFIQELFLVLPKALTPGLRPTLFHNNHTWQGQHPLAALFQGTGALATFATGMGCALLLQRRQHGSATRGLLLFWMAYAGMFMALPQVALGAFSPGSDVGMAMNHLGLASGPRTVAAIAALAAMPLIACWLAHALLGLATEDDRTRTAWGRTVFVFRAATLPALIALPMIIAFRVPRDWIEVAVVPLAVTLAGVPWLQAAAWLTRPTPTGRRSDGSLAWPLAAVLLLLAVFQLLLRPGVRFH